MSFFDTGSRIMTQPAILDKVFHKVELRCSCWFRFSLPFLMKAVTLFLLIHSNFQRVILTPAVELN